MSRINESMETENRLAIVYSLEMGGGMERDIFLWRDDENIMKGKSWSHNSRNAL